MKVLLQWFLTGKTSVLEDTQLLNPESTMAEVKGLIQVQFGFQAKNTLIIANKQLREDHETLRSAGITDQTTAERSPLTVHVFTGQELEDDTLEDGDDDLQEFTHEDFIKASKMLGRTVGVPSARLEVAKAAPPKQRPEFLNRQASAPTAEAPTSESPGAKESKRAEKIFRDVMYGPRRDGLEKTLAITYPGVSEVFDFWDLRMTEKPFPVAPGDVALEAFFFGEFKPVDPTRFARLVEDMISRRGYRVQLGGSAREAGCMYPLIAVPIALADEEAVRLGDLVFEDFGKIPSAMKQASADIKKNAAASSASGGCAQQ